MTPHLSLISLQSAGSKELRSQGGIIGKVAAPDSSAGYGRCFPHSAHFHAEMMRFEEDGYTMRMEHGFQSVRNLLTDAFLYGETLGKESHQAGQLGNADDIFMGNVAHIRLAVKRKRMMLTKRKEGDRSFYDLAAVTVRLAMTFRIKDS